jgi:RNA recognition motif-containing protein
VTFSDKADAERALDMQTKEKHTIRGKAVQIKMAFSKEQTREKLMRERKRKLFIDTIPESLSKENFEDYFSKFGDIEEIRVIHEKRKNGTKKNFCFILFAEEKGLEKCMEKGGEHIIMGHALLCNQTKLREELKVIQLKKQKEKNKGIEGEGKKKKKKRKRKKNKGKKGQQTQVKKETATQPGDTGPTKNKNSEDQNVPKQSETEVEQSGLQLPAEIEPQKPPIVSVQPPAEEEELTPINKALKNIRSSQEFRGSYQPNPTKTHFPTRLSPSQTNYQAASLNAYAQQHQLQPHYQIRLSESPQPFTNRLETSDTMLSAALSLNRPSYQPHQRLSSHSNSSLKSGSTESSHRGSEGYGRRRGNANLQEFYYNQPEALQGFEPHRALPYETNSELRFPQSRYSGHSGNTIKSTPNDVFNGRGMYGYGWNQRNSQYSDPLNNFNVIGQQNLDLEYASIRAIFEDEDEDSAELNSLGPEKQPKLTNLSGTQKAKGNRAISKLSKFSNCKKSVPGDTYEQYVLGFRVSNMSENDKSKGLSKQEPSQESPFRKRETIGSDGYNESKSLATPENLDLRRNVAFGSEERQENLSDVSEEKDDFLVIEGMDVEVMLYGRQRGDNLAGMKPLKIDSTILQKHGEQKTVDRLKTGGADN